MTKKIMWGAVAILLAIPSFVYLYLSKFSPTYSMLSERLAMGQRPTHLLIYQLCGVALYGLIIFLLASVAIFAFRKIAYRKNEG